MSSQKERSILDQRSRKSRNPNPALHQNARNPSRYIPPWYGKKKSAILEIGFPRLVKYTSHAAGDPPTTRTGVRSKPRNGKLVARPSPQPDPDLYTASRTITVSQKIEDRMWMGKIKAHHAFDAQPLTWSYLAFDRQPSDGRERLWHIELARYIENDPRRPTYNLVEQSLNVIKEISHLLPRKPSTFKAGRPENAVPDSAFDTSLALQGLRPRGEYPPNWAFAGWIFTPRGVKRVRVIDYPEWHLYTTAVPPRHISDSGNFSPDNDV
ncbi:hypothetical protein BDM02DRAFT_3130049 [Thelephora ganbajun]|uniref:Uncharacterized protein n=1 Tax=Thelephora ganbajun TaxID=370292 RepID=A0ACB6ZBC6_THEGA|nr:hypothetical protein BDM02DRAFT_3130049 [Thelephora ganbajun]